MKYDLSEIRPLSVTTGGYVSEPINFYYLLPDNNNWECPGLGECQH
jgi:hypothetical protein